ncbi:MAG: hypothetical protein SGILL_007363, partial [Bacillariaceae sp.]
VPPGMNAEIMGQLMTNPALAAAAAASPLFPPAAMLTNPGAFLTMPEYYRSAGAVQNDQSARESAATISNAVAVQAQQVTAGQAVQQQAGFNMQALAAQFQQQNPQQQNGNRMFPIPSTQHTIMPYGAALPPPGLIPNQMAPSSVQAHMAASAAASQAIAGVMGDVSTDEATGKGGKRKKDMTAAERAKQNRERNREHAKSTRLRKKAYIQKLKELVEGLHAERTEEVRQRRVAIQHLAEMQNVRRNVIRSFLRFHSNYEKDKRKWETILEDSFWLKQPVTPYRCFRRSEIEQPRLDLPLLVSVSFLIHEYLTILSHILFANVEQEARIARGIDAAVADAASVAAMIEGVGSRSNRWVQIKREDFLIKEEERTGRKRMPKSIMQQNNRFQHAVSSLSSSSNSSNNGSSGDDSKTKKRSHSSALGSSEYHDYHAKPLPDPKLGDQDRNSNSSNSGEDDSPDDSNSADDAKQISSIDASSGDDSNAAIKESRTNKRQKVEERSAKPVSAGAAAAEAKNNILPSNIAKKGGIAHNVMPVMNNALPKNGNARLSLAPAVQLPPFAGLGKRSQVPSGAASSSQSVSMNNDGSDKNTNSMPAPTGASANPLAASALPGPAVISGDFETSSSSSSRSKPQIRGYYHINEDDMILMEDVIMCPFVFRTQDAVLCGVLAECVQPGMLRAHFSSTNKLLSMEMIYDAMGFMQQLERASGSELMAQIIPGSLEMALSPGSAECRVITLAEPPFRIVNVNEAWTKLTKYTQMDVEGSELFGLLDPPAETDDQPTNPPNDLDEVLEGCCKCTTRFHCDKDGREFVDFISSYPLTNASDEITHILHVSKELAPMEVSTDENQASSATTEEMNDANS